MIRDGKWVGPGVLASECIARFLQFVCDQLTLVPAMPEYDEIQGVWKLQECASCDGVAVVVDGGCMPMCAEHLLDGYPSKKLELVWYSPASAYNPAEVN